MDFLASVPKGLYQNLRFREFIYYKAAEDVKLQQALREVCRRDILFWVNCFVWTFDPRLKDNKIIPFITYPYQDAALIEMQDAIRQGDPAVAPKSRDMGASWLVLLAFDHEATYERDCKFFAMSRNAKMVDEKGNSDSLFWKIDCVHRWLPSWLRPTVEQYRGERTNMKITYQETNSVIIGGTTTKAAGIGGRATAVLVDEFSRFEPLHARLVKSGLKDVSNCVIYPFTRNPEMGRQHPSYELVEQAKKGHIRSIPMHWTQHPVKAIGHYRVSSTTREIETIDKTYKFPPNYKFQLDGRFEHHSVWFDKYRTTSGNDREVSENLEFDDDIGGHLVFDAVMIKDYAAVHARPPDLEGDLIYDAVTGEAHEFVPLRGGPIKLWMTLDVHGKPPAVEYGAGGDISLGMGRTNSAFSAARCDIGVKVLEFATPSMKPDAYAVKCVAICNWLNSPKYRTLLGWERGGPGETFGIEVQKLGYYPIYYHIDKTKNTSDVRKPTPGIPNNIKGSLFAAYQTDLARAAFINHSAEGLAETLEWQHTSLGPKHNADKNRVNDPSGATLNHGDRTVADANCAMMVRERGGGALQPKEIVVEGSLAAFMREREREDSQNRGLYPNWHKKII